MMMYLRKRIFKNILDEVSLINLICLDLSLVVALILYHIQYGIYGRIACEYYEETGILCPTCGATRMFMSLIHLNLLQALQNNALCLLGMPYAAYMLIRYITDRKIYIREFVIIAIITIVFTLLRNLDAFWFLQPV